MSGDRTALHILSNSREERPSVGPIRPTNLRSRSRSRLYGLYYNNPHRGAANDHGLRSLLHRRTSIRAQSADCHQPRTVCRRPWCRCSRLSSLHLSGVAGFRYLGNHIPWRLRPTPLLRVFVVENRGAAVRGGPARQASPGQARCPRLRAQFFTTKTRRARRSKVMGEPPVDAVAPGANVRRLTGNAIRSFSSRLVQGRDRLDHVGEVAPRLPQIVRLLHPKPQFGAAPAQLADTQGHGRRDR